MLVVVVVVVVWWCGGARGGDGGGVVPVVVVWWLCFVCPDFFTRPCFCVPSVFFFVPQPTAEPYTAPGPVMLTATLDVRDDTGYATTKGATTTSATTSLREQVGQAEFLFSKRLHHSGRLVPVCGT